MRLRGLWMMAGLGLAACATTVAPATSWGKAGVSMTDYWSDASQCALVGAQAAANPPAGNVEAVGSGTDYARVNNAGVSNSATGGGDLKPVGAYGAEVDTNISDAVARANYNEARRKQAAEKARQDAVDECLSGRGYRQFQLTDEQRAHLAGLAEGSSERREYLYSLGADSSVLQSQGM
jgi:hypothetical protein